MYTYSYTRCRYVSPSALILWICPFGWLRVYRLRKCVGPSQMCAVGSFFNVAYRPFVKRRAGLNRLDIIDPWQPLNRLGGSALYSSSIIANIYRQVTFELRLWIVHHARLNHLEEKSMDRMSGRDNTISSTIIRKYLLSLALSVSWAVWHSLRRMAVGDGLVYRGYTTAADYWHAQIVNSPTRARAALSKYVRP
jgi:hypothetical protein